MNKFIATITFLSLAGFAQAQTTTPARNPGIMREGVKKPMQQIKATNFKIGTSTKNMMGSTTKGMMQEKRVLKMTAKKGEALAIQTTLIERLTKALDTLTLTKTNLSTLIDKRVAEGKPVGNAKALLATASTKIESARKAVNAVVIWKPDVKTATTTEISLTKPRATANIAIKAVQDARLAIVAVMRELKGKEKPVETATSTNNQ
jgi:hypothetical protein